MDPATFSPTARDACSSRQALAYWHELSAAKSRSVCTMTVVWKNMMKVKPVRASVSEYSEMALPNDANGLGNVLGGKVMHLVDLAAAMAAMRHARRPVSPLRSTVCTSFIRSDRPADRASLLGESRLPHAPWRWGSRWRPKIC